MNGIAAIKAALESTKHVVHQFLGDFSDADLLVRPVPGANHAAWQIGNVIVGDGWLIQSELPDAVFPPLPPGFAEQHGSEGANKEGPEGFLRKAVYFDLFDKTRAATIAALEKLADADLDRPTNGPMKGMAPTLGHVFLFAANHTLMHAGQFSVIRRKLGKPVLF